MHNSRKGGNSDKEKNGSAIFPWGIYMWIFKILACTVHKLWYASDFIQILFKGALPKKGRELGQKKCVKYFPMRNPYIWNFEILACTVLVDWRTDARVHTRNQYAPSVLGRWGINTSETIVIIPSYAKNKKQKKTLTAHYFITYNVRHNDDKNRRTVDKRSHHKNNYIDLWIYKGFISL